MTRILKIRFSVLYKYFYLIISWEDNRIKDLKLTHFNQYY